MTPFASEDRAPVKLSRPDRAWVGPILLIGLVMLLLAACAPVGQNGGSPGASAAVTPTPTPLVPAHPGADPISLMAWLFTPIFQALFILLVALYQVLGQNIAIAIIVLTLIIRAATIPLFRQQTVSQRRMQLLQPEIKEIQRRFKGDRVKIQEATMALYKERGVNPAAGCLPLVLQFALLIPMYSVISGGLQNYDPSAMLRVFDVQLIDLHCPSAPALDALGHVVPCIHTQLQLPLLGTVDVGRPEYFGPIPIITGISVLAIVSALLQLVQSRMMLPQGDPTANDPQTKTQRQMMLFLPFISIFYGAILPAGLFIYWIVTTIFSIVQQYLIVGWGGMFPIFGWHPSFARAHAPRFPVAVPAPVPTSRAAGAPPRPTPTDRAASAAATVRPRERGRQGRRGRRR